MKKINIALVLLMTVISLTLTSCSVTETNMTTTVASKTSQTSDFSTLLSEMEILKNQKSDLIAQQGVLNNKIIDLEQQIAAASFTNLFETNYSVVSIIEKMHTDSISQVDVFPGILKNISSKIIDERTYFVFAIDRLEINPNWHGAGTAGEQGYFLNKEVQFDEYVGGIDTCFDFKAYKSYGEKQADILANYGQENTYTFYSVGAEIVFVLSNAGP